MTLRLQLALILCVCVFTAIVLVYLIKRKLNLRYSLIWLLMAISMLIAAMFPSVVSFLSNLIGIRTPSNAIFALFLFFAYLIIFSLTTIVSHMNARIVRLIQTQAILEERVRKLEEQHEAGKPD